MKIGRKFSLWVVLTLLLIIAATMIIFSSFELREEKKKLEAFSRMTGQVVEESLTSYMLERNSNKLNAKLADFKKHTEAFEDIWVLNRTGVVTNSTDTKSIGAGWKDTFLPPAGRNHNGYLLADKDIFRWVQTVANKAECHKCHDKRSAYNGSIIIDFSLNKVLDHVRREMITAAMIMLFALLFTGMVVLVLWHLLVEQRLNSMVNKIRKVKEGIYDNDQVREGKDELTRLEEDFHTMAEAVRAREEEKQNLVKKILSVNTNLVNEIDIRTQTEAMLRDQKLFSDALIENSATATFVVDKDHRVLLWNKACEELTGFQGAVMVGTDEHWKAFYSNPRPTLADLVLDGRHKDLQSHYDRYAPSALIENGYHAEGWYHDLNGKDRYIMFDAAPIKDSRGEIAAVIETIQDVTERIKTETALARSETKLRTIIETEPECVKQVAMDGKILEINRAGLDMMEADLPEQVVGLNLLQLAVPEHQSAVQAHLERAFREGSDSLEFEIFGLKGTRRWFETRAAVLPDPGGGPVALLAVTRDVTDRKQWDHQLREQVQFLKTLMDTIPMPVFYKDKEGLYQGCNRAFEEFIGLPQEKLIGKTVYDIASKERADEYDRKDRELLEHPGIQIYDYSVKHADGSIRDAVFTKATYSDGNGRVAGLLGVIQDVTRRKQAEEKLRQTNQTLETLISASPLAILMLDPNGHVLLWNPAAEQIFGWTAEEVMGRLNPIVPGDKMDEFMQLRDRVMQGETILGLEIRRQTKQGRDVDLSISTAPLRDANGNVNAIAAILADITERKRVEAAIKRHYDTQTAINWILHISLENMPLENILKQTLDLILSIPWLSFESRGAIFLVQEDADTLVMKAERGLSDTIKSECRMIPFGKCLCGRAAARGEVQFADSLDDRHEVHYQHMTSHGHYCVPIKHGRSVLGVINIYLKEGHLRDQREVEFLSAIANALAGVIRRGKTEAALQESEKRYRILAEAAHDVIFIVNQEGRIEYINSYGADLLHREAHALIGEELAGLFGYEDTSDQSSSVAIVFDSGVSLYVENPFSFGQSETWLGTWLVPLKDNNSRVSSVLGVSRDITERRRFEQEREKLILDLQAALQTVSRSHKEWQETFDSITDMIAIIGKDCRIMKANKAFAGYFGFHPRDVINRKCFEIYHQSDKPIASCPHIKTIKERQAFSEELLDGKTNRIFRVTTFPYFSPDGDIIIGSIHVSRDVTDEKEREARLITSERLAALGQMASGIAHEINNPLASIAGCSEGLLVRIKKGQCDYKLFETYLNIIQEEIFRCKSITTAMLSFVRKTTYEKKEVGLSEMLDKTVEIISFQGRLKSVNVNRSYPEEPIRVHANEGELRQVFLAIITNALDAMADKGTITLETGLHGKSAVVRIIDTGPGIEVEHLNRIFDPFFTTKSERGGTGLGLSIARKIIHNHNGTIEVSSDHGKGTIFTIQLPL